MAAISSTIPEGVRCAMGIDDPGLHALATVGELAATVVHEIKGPLTIADGYLQILQNHVNDGRSREICQKIRSQLEHIDQLVQGLLFLARSHRPNLRPCRVDQIVKNAISMIQATAVAHGVEIRVTGLAHAPEICADPGQITQVILNLLLNALEAMPSGGTTWVRLRYLESLGVLGLTVADNGPGIPADVRGKLFQPFVTTKEGGTGLGLTICRNIVSQHGGDIRIRSGRRGTTVRVTLPVACASIPAPECRAARACPDAAVTQACHAAPVSRG